MGITVEEIQKRFSDSQLFDILRKSPYIKDEVEKILSAEEQAEKAAREAVIDGLESNSRRVGELDKQIAAQRLIHDETHAAFRREADKLGGLLSERAACQTHEGQLCCQLSQLGEGRLSFAMQLLDEGLRSWPSQIDELEFQINTATRDRFDGRWPSAHVRRVAALAELKARLRRHQEGIATLRRWAYARVSPREQTARVDALLEAIAAAEATPA